MNIPGLKFHRTPQSFSISAGSLKATWGEEPQTESTDSVHLSSKAEQAELLEAQTKGLKQTSAIYHWTSKAALTAGMGLALMGGAALAPVALGAFGIGLITNGMARDLRSTAIRAQDRVHTLKMESSLAQQPAYFAGDAKAS